MEIETLRTEAVAKARTDHVRVAEIDIGQAVRQGDVYLRRIETVPAGATEIERPSPQIAPGSTQGSRHVVDPMTGVRVFRLASPGMLDGPVVVSEGTLTVTHPEHGWLSVPAGVYAVTYQREYVDKMRRVSD